MADYYRLQVSEYADFHQLTINTVVETVTEYDFTGLDYYTTYYWRVKRVNNITGKESDWSTVCEFITRAANITIIQTSASNTIIYETGGNIIYPPACLLQDGQLGTCLRIVSGAPLTGQLGTVLAFQKCLISQDET